MAAALPPDVFGRNTGAWGGGFSADSTTVLFDMGADLGEKNSVGLLIQNVSVSYQQAVNRIYEVSSNNVYMTGGRTSGSMNLARVLGPTVLATAFYTKYGNMCDASGNNLIFSGVTGCTQNGVTTSGRELRFTAKFIILNALTIGVDSQSMMINESMSAIFGFLTMG